MMNWMSEYKECLCKEWWAMGCRIISHVRFQTTWQENLMAENFGGFAYNICRCCQKMEKMADLSKNSLIISTTNISYHNVRTYVGFVCAYSQSNLRTCPNVGSRTSCLLSSDIQPQSTGTLALGCQVPWYIGHESLLGSASRR